MIGGPLWLPRPITNWPERKLLWVLTLSALAIRLYLSLTAFAISSDGMEYVRMARDFAANDSGRALDTVFSPLFPWLIAIAHHLLPDWELDGNLISAAFGTATVPLLYLLTKEVFARRDLAAGAAALAAIHPAMAEYSAAVRTDAGFICLMLGALYLLISGVNRGGVLRTAAAGAVGGLAYLYRAEAIGLLMVCAVFLPTAALLWKRWGFVWAVGRALAFGLPFLLVASPYLLYLHQATGHWIVSRELNVAASASVIEVAADKAKWEALARSHNTSVLAPLLLDPGTYARKVGYDTVMSVYYFAEAIGWLPLGLLLVGLGVRGSGIFGSWSESLLALLAAFYFFGFALFNTGPRFMVHLIPYTFGWLMLGLEAASVALGRVPLPVIQSAPRGSLAMVLAAILLPATLWPIGYDIRGFRYAAYDMTHSDRPPKTIIACDARVAFYAGARFVNLPASPPAPDVCGWLLSQEGANYLMVGRREERRWGDLRARPCLRFVKRYPRIGAGYYDLFLIERPSSGQNPR